MQQNSPRLLWDASAAICHGSTVLQGCPTPPTPLPLFAEQQDMGEDTTICKQMPTLRLLKSCSGRTEISEQSPQEPGAGNAHIIAADPNTAAFAQKAVPTHPTTAIVTESSKTPCCKSCTQGGWAQQGLGSWQQPTNSTGPAAPAPCTSPYTAQTLSRLLSPFTLIPAKKNNCRAKPCTSRAGLTPTSKDCLLNPEHPKTAFPREPKSSSEHSLDFTHQFPTFKGQALPLAFKQTRLPHQLSWPRRGLSADPAFIQGGENTQHLTWSTQHLLHIKNCTQLSALLGSPKSPPNWTIWHSSCTQLALPQPVF